MTTTRTIIDLDYYQWHEPRLDASDEPRLLLPYDTEGSAIDAIFDTIDAAQTFRDELVTDQGHACAECDTPLELSDGQWWHAEECPPDTLCAGGMQDRLEPAETPDALKWVLVHYEGTVVS